MIFVYPNNPIECVRSNCAIIVLARFMLQWKFTTNNKKQSMNRAFTKQIWNQLHREASNCLFVMERFEILDMWEAVQKAIIGCLWPTELHPVPQISILANMCSKNQILKQS